MKNFKLFSNVPKLYKSMINDIEKAEKFIYLETYIYGKDKTGLKFKNALIKKAREGVKICLLIDGWGSYVDREYFSKLIKLGADVRLFKEFKYFVRIIAKNHERNHRKLLIIDDKVCYIGSANIADKFLSWRELSIRLTGNIVKYFILAFMQTWEIYSEVSKKKIKSFLYREYEILQDFPNYKHRTTEKKLKKLIRQAKKSILIETPYFVPSPSIRKSLKSAVKRKVKVTIILPHDSSVKIVDLFRDRFLGNLHQGGIEIKYYMPSTLHTKLLIVDDKYFMFGSSNLDYRSFLHQFELNIFGKNKYVIRELIKYFNETQKHTEPFNYDQWKNRSSFKKMIEMIISTIEYYL
ncbi:phosphatidylserine/phosphatidylglycerophosphate/cardiolipin synthase family protein [Candidatus Pacearchaeota archaeon]|nr:phosphatidylserine/phosphatidylglycerophosphate/cardiolipin synthase family protein [Candidatus Pacearchaeota archaeon]